MKDKIIKTLKTVDRPGIDNLIQFLEDSDFFKAPASTKYHGNYEGGLAEHSWNVYQVFKRKVAAYKLDIPEDSIIIAGLLHDICKVNFYKRDTKNVLKGKKDNGYGKMVNNWVEEEVWIVEDKFPVGHGEKSVILLQNFIPLRETEILLIRWHMGGFEPSENRIYMYNAIEMCPAVVALHTADMEVTYFMDKKEEN